MEKCIAILMSDLSGYTAVTEVHGSAESVSVIEKFVSLAERSLFGKSRIFERIGDQLAIVSEDADDLAKSAIALHRHAQKEPHFLPLHAGLHFGPVLEQYGSFYGSTVNVAARIAAESKERSLLASYDFISALKNPKSFHYKFYGSPWFKHVLNRTRLFEIIADVENHPVPYHIDPVCHMQLTPDENRFIYKVAGKKYRFCSDKCLSIFAVNERQFLK